MAETLTETACTCCGSDLDRDELESPNLDGDGDPICDQCYHDKYEFTCCCCEEYGDVKDQHKMLVVFEKIGGVQPGIYGIVEFPYYTQGLIGSGWLHLSSLKRIGDVNPDMDGNGYPCGHLCAECQAKVKAQRKGTCQFCKCESSSCIRVRLGSWKDFEASKYQWTRPKIVCAKCRHEHRGSWKISKEQTK